MRNLKWLLVASALSVLCGALVAQVAHDEGWVFSLAFQPDGKILAGGSFTHMNGTRRAGIARLNPGGTLDDTLNAALVADEDVWFTPAVEQIAVQPDGKILITGSFIVGQGSSARKNFVRLNPSGSLDVAFNPQVSGHVTSFAIQPDGRILIGGSFSTVGGVAQPHIARLNADGTLDTTFSPALTGASVPTLGIVNSIAIQPDGRIVLGGEFTEVDGIARENIARLNSDGSLDASFVPGTPDSAIYSVAVNPSGTIFATGPFNDWDGQPRSRTARLESNGTLDTSYQPGGIPTYSVQRSVHQPDGKTLLCGPFYAIDGHTALASGASKLMAPWTHHFQPTSWTTSARRA